MFVVYRIDNTTDFVIIKSQNFKPNCKFIFQFQSFISMPVFFLHQQVNMLQKTGILESSFSFRRAYPVHKSVVIKPNPFIERTNVPLPHRI